VTLGEIVGSDGLRARDNGAWGEEKLAFLDYFAPVALRATERKTRRCYVDLFAGPGLNRVRGSSQEYDGSPLRAIEVIADNRPDLSFTDAFFINRDRRDHQALRERIERRINFGRSRMPREQIQCIRGDANEKLRAILDQIDPRSYILVFADMEAPKQCRWSTVEALRRYRSHQSVDLYILFPLDMALKRLLSRNAATVEQSARTLDSFFGDDRWRGLLRFRQTDSQADRDALSRGLLDLYVCRLRELWTHVEVICDIRRGMHHRLYKMLFASKDDAGRKIAAWAKRRSRRQVELALTS